jgi:HbrB-like
MSGLLARGMVTLNVKLSELDDKQFLPRLAEVWEFFWHSILPYVEGVRAFLPTNVTLSDPSSTGVPPAQDRQSYSISLAYAQVKSTVFTKITG